MAENLLKEGWYPKTKLKSYSYAKKLEIDNPELHTEIKNLLAKSKDNLTKAQEPSTKRLEQLWKQERAKEIQVIKLLTKDTPNFSLSEEVGAYIKIINHLFQLDSVLERNISKIQAVSKGNNIGRIDVTSYFGEYLQNRLSKAVDDWLASGKDMISVTDLKEIFYQAMLDMFGAIDNGVQAYSELAFQLENMQREERDDILNDIFYLYFGKSIAELTEEFAEAGEGVKFNPQSVVITKGKGFQGNVLETVEQLTLREMQKILKDKNITTSSIGTGSSGAKADNILTIGFQLTDKQVDLLTGKSLLSSSVREQNIQRMQQFHKSLQDSRQSGYIVEISDKNYNLTSARFASEKGFTAQHNVKLINLKQTLKNIKFQQGKVEDIIFILANSGTNLINEKETSEATHYLATLIGYFLFDDIDIKNFIPTQPSAIHLLNLDGVYIPLSVFLEAACEAFATSVEQAEKFTYVTFHETKEGKNYNTDNILTENDWIRFREERMNNSSVNFHFFGDFVNFISQKL